MWRGGGEAPSTFDDQTHFFFALSNLLAMCMNNCVIINNVLNTNTLHSKV